jgi:DNA polymerase I-like protein with 3'-5' exonuclease and polymerase domains
MIAIDTETTGLDLYHGAKPYFVSTCDEHGSQLFWEWDVDPLTRQPKVPKRDITELKALVRDAAGLILHNAKFDVAALAAVDPWFANNWPWEKTYDTLMAGHLVHSGLPHNLTDMAMHYLGVDVEPLEKDLERITQECRRYCRTHLPEWAIAKEGRADMPSAREKTWKADGWLPAALAPVFGHDDDSEYRTCLRDYANADTAATRALWPVLEREIKGRGLWDIFLTRMKVIPVALRMERRGITVNAATLAAAQAEYRDESEARGRVCMNVAKSYGYELVLPANGVNNSLREFCFGKLGLPEVRNPKAKTDAPTLNKAAMDQYVSTLDPKSKQYTFVKALVDKRSRDTAVAYMEAYKRFWLPAGGDYYVLHPNLNPTGTKTLRWGCENPSEHNISKKEGFNIRRCFGPAPGREWWSLDFQNIELRIPAYEAGEADLIYIFEHPDEPPYYGSYHLVIADVLHPELFKQHGKKFKDVFKATWYQWVKNGNFARQYGAQEKLVDRTYRVEGAYKLISKRFPKIDALNRKTIAAADKTGYVETIPDKTVCSDRGYPLVCGGNEWGGISPTIPFCYRVQGSAMWTMQMAMIKADDRLGGWREAGFDGHIIMQVHDEMVFDFPKSPVHPREDTGRFRRSNLWRIDQIRRDMENCGMGIGVPTPTSCTYHEVNWAEGVDL